MKTIIFYIYLALMNFSWVFTFLVSLAGGHGITFKNTEVRDTVFISLICIMTTLLLIFYKKSRAALCNILLYFFLSLLLFSCCYVFYLVLKAGEETYFINVPFYIVLVFIFYYTLRIMYLLYMSKFSITSISVLTLLNQAQVFSAGSNKELK